VNTIRVAGAHSTYKLLRVWMNGQPVFAAQRAFVALLGCPIRFADHTRITCFQITDRFGNV
jgi:hypothetical protein